VARLRLADTFVAPGIGNLSWVQRDSNRHSPRLDDELKGETESLVRGAPVESRAEEWREQEGAADGEREPSARTRADGLNADEVAQRSDLSRHLRLSVFPAAREALLAEAEANNAPAHVLADLRRLPPDATFGSVHEVWAALTGTVETVTGRPLRHSKTSPQDEHQG
jgi:Protein of unknown function (DUF2795)